MLNALPASTGWWLGFVLGPLLGVVILFIRRNIPESPRWLITHGREREAEKVTSGIEAEARAAGQTLGDVDERQAITLRPEKDYGYLTFLRLVFRQYTKRAILGARSRLRSCRAITEHANIAGVRCSGDVWSTRSLEGLRSMADGEHGVFDLAYVLRRFAQACSRPVSCRLRVPC